MSGIRILGAGTAPGDVSVTNEDLSRIVAEALSKEGKSDPVFSDAARGSRWILQRTGIRRRTWAVRKSNVEMAAEAASGAILDAGVNKDDIGILIVCTFTPDQAAPSTASAAAGKLGLRKDLLAFDLNAACSGFLYGLAAADALLSAADARCTESGFTPGGSASLALVIGSEKISPLLDRADPTTAVLFGDGAGAVVIAHDESREFRFQALSSPKEEILYCSSPEGKVRMQGQNVYRFAARNVPGAVMALLGEAGLRPGEVDHFVFHQSNARILEASRRRLGISEDQMFRDIETWGNTSSASVAIALSEMKAGGLLRSGERIVLCGYGAGMTAGAALLTG